MAKLPAADSYPPNWPVAKKDIIPHMQFWKLSQQVQDSLSLPSLAPVGVIGGCGESLI